MAIYTDAHLAGEMGRRPEAKVLMDFLSQAKRARAGAWVGVAGAAPWKRARKYSRSGGHGRENSA
jgi:hypothetical protein